jgi:effector-binding domain-containing protein
MPYLVRTEHADPRRLASIRTTTSRAKLGPTIIAMLDQIWPVLREQGVRTDHNVVIYYGSTEQGFDIDVGVETLSEFTGPGPIALAQTPSGEVATIAHFGDYADMGPAYAALEQWCVDNDRQPTGVRWEVYGDWDDDPTKRRTDIYFALT